MKLNDIYNKPIGFYDFETSGLDPERHEILEVGAVVLHPDLRFKRAMNYRLIPEHLDRADAKALQVNGYTPDGWRKAIPQKTGINMLLKFLSECGAVFAHNASFDYGFLEFGVRRHQIDLPLPRYRMDTMTLAWLYQKTYRGYFTLKASCEAVGVRAEGPVHVAVNGALAEARFLRKLLCEYDETREKATKWDFTTRETVADIVPEEPADGF